MKYFKKIIFLCIFTISLSIFINDKVTANEIDDEPLNVGIPCGGSIMDFCDDDGSGGTGGGTSPYSSSTEIPLTKKENTYTEELKESSHIYKFTTNFAGSYIIQVGLWGHYETINISIEKKGDVSHPISSEEIIGSRYELRNNQVEFSYGFPSPLLSGDTTYYINIDSEKEIDAVLDITIINYDQDDNFYLFGYTQLNPNTSVSRNIDYEGDVDYYTFTNLGGVYDIYSTGYGTGNIDTKAELYLCNDSNCSSHNTNPIVTNDNHPSTISFSGMGSNDFGMKVDLGYKNLGKTYLIKLYHYNNAKKGKYTLNINHIGTTKLPLFNNSTPIDLGIKWTFNYDMSKLSNSVCKVDLLVRHERCKELYQYTITSETAMYRIEQYLSKEAGILDDSDIFGITKTSLVDGGSLAVPEAFKQIVNHYGWNEGQFVKALKAIGYFLLIVDYSDKIQQDIARGQIGTFRDMIDSAEYNDFSLIFTYQVAEKNILGQTYTNLYLSSQDINEVSRIINSNINQPKTDLQISTENDILYGKLNYIENMDEIDTLIHQYFEQYYGILPW